MKTATNSKPTRNSARIVPSRDVEPPRPLLTTVGRLKVAAGDVVTSIVRVWRTADVARCRLCPQCIARPVSKKRSMCGMMIRGYVPRHETATFSMWGFRHDPPKNPTRINDGGTR